MKYVALLRGINVGGKNMIPMAALKKSLEKDGFRNIRTYIQSGNILFESTDGSTTKLAAKFEKHILDVYGHTVPTVVISEAGFKKILDSAPKNWGSDPEWKYNTLFLFPPLTAEEAIASIGVLRPDIETLAPADGAVYQSSNIKQVGRALTGKLAGMPVYQKMTVRNWNTTKKFFDLLNQ